MPQVIRRKPLQPSTRALELEKGPRLPGTDMHPTLRRTWYDENGKLVSNETAHGSVPLVNYSVSQQYLPPPDSSRIYGHQLFPVLPYAESEKVIVFATQNHIRLLTNACGRRILRPGAKAATLLFASDKTSCCAWRAPLFIAVVMII